jgi:hypothetical protein
MVLLGGLVGHRVHLVGRGGEEENLGTFAMKEFARELCDLVISMQEMPESLKLVKDDEIWFQSLDAAVREKTSQLANQFVTSNAILPRDMFPVALKPLTEVRKTLAQVFGPADLNYECGGEPWIDLGPALVAKPLKISSPSICTRSALEHILGSRAMEAPRFLEKAIEESALLHDPDTRSEVEGGPRRKRDKVELPRFQIPCMEGQEREAGREREFILPLKLEAVDILTGDIAVGADIDDVNPGSGAPKTINGARDDSSRY